MKNVNYFKVIPAEILTVKADKGKTVSVFGYEQDKVDLFEKRTKSGLYSKVKLGNVNLFFVNENIASVSAAKEQTTFKFKNGAELTMTGNHSSGFEKYKPKRKPRKTKTAE